VITTTAAAAGNQYYIRRECNTPDTDICVATVAAATISAGICCGITASVKSAGNTCTGAGKPLPAYEYIQYLAWCYSQCSLGTDTQSKHTCSRSTERT